MWEGRMIRVWIFCSCIPRLSLVLSALSFLGHHINGYKEVTILAISKDMLTTENLEILQKYWGV